MFPLIFGFLIFSVLEQFNLLQMLQVGFFFPVSLIVGSSASVVYGIRQVIFFVFLIIYDMWNIFFIVLWYFLPNWACERSKTHPLKFMSLSQNGTRLQDEWLKKIFQMHKGMTSDLVKKGTAKRERRTLIMVKIKIKDTSGTYFDISTVQQFWMDHLGTKKSYIPFNIERYRACPAFNTISKDMYASKT